MRVCVIFLTLYSIIFSQQLFYKNLELIDKDGNIKADIIVGANASITDSIAAIKIQNFLISNSYKKTNVRANLVSYPNVTCNKNNIGEYGYYLIKNASVEFLVEYHYKNSTYFSLKNRDYLDNVTGNYKLDTNLNNITNVRDYLTGYELDEKKLSLLAPKLNSIENQKIMQKNKMYITAFKEIETNALTINRLTYFIQLYNIDENLSGLQKCFPKFREDYYYAYCSLTNDRDVFIGNLNFEIEIFGTKYQLLDMAIPFINNLSSKKDTVFGGKIVLGENKSIIKISSGQKLNLNNQWYTFYVFDNWVDVIAGDQSKLYSFEKGFLFKLGNNYFKLVNISNKQATFFVFDNIHYLNHNGSFKQFRVFLEWTNNGPERYRFYESSRRADALKSIILVDENSYLITSFPYEFYNNTGLYLLNHGTLNNFLNISVIRNNKNLNFYDTDCNLKSANNSFNIKITTPNGMTKEIYYFSDLNSFALRSSHRTEKKNCTGVVSLDNRSISIGVDNESHISLMLDLDKGNDNLKTLSLVIYDYSGKLIERQNLIVNNSVHDNLHSSYGIQKIFGSRQSVELSVPTTYLQTIYSIYYSKSVFDSKELTLTNSSYLILDKDLIFKIRINTMNERCQLNLSELRCNLVLESFQPVIEFTSSGNSSYLNSTIVYFQKTTKSTDNSFIYLDKDYEKTIKQKRVKIVIGGYFVNAYAKGMMKLSTNQSVIQIINNSIIIAGFSKDDTIREVDKFISYLNRSISSV
ncbi:MAG: hypothetical protein N3E37_00565 [Candidatus Micrarchaeota archaeon]|nr:hypothetical protein [Candidatus Micrarchaeota archaeon]